MTYNGATIGSTIVGIVADAGAIFRLGDLSTQAAALNQDGTVNGPSHPAPIGSYISLYGTGFGQTQAPGVTGSLFTGTASSLVTANPVAVTIENIPAQVQYAGAAPFDWAGIDQINVQIPAGVPSGVASIGVTSEPSGNLVTIWVK